MAAIVVQKNRLSNRLAVMTKVEALGNGAPANGDDIVTNLKDYPLGSDYSDLTGLIVYRRLGIAKVAADWVALNPGS